MTDPGHHQDNHHYHQRRHHHHHSQSGGKLATSMHITSLRGTADDDNDADDADERTGMTLTMILFEVCGDCPGCKRDGDAAG